ncbi:MAG: hypothetical protein LBS86_01275 [Treponema sp.]|nr:hypothetical protein [Treponema sp.]
MSERYFNVTGPCVSDKHYMVDTSEKINQIKIMVDRGDYFTINRARQYGKTTTLNLLRRRLFDEYICAPFSFGSVGDASFETETAFCATFMRRIQNALRLSSMAQDADYIASWVDTAVTDIDRLGVHITKQCEGKKIVLMIDEVDASSNYRVYIRFLAMLRDKYLARADGNDFTFHSVILAGVYDIKNIKLKMISAGVYNPQVKEGTVYNSPWNIAANFKVDMSFNTADISTMLAEYKSDHEISMDIPLISQKIYDYTSGYPFLVSRICKLIDEDFDKDWTLAGVEKAVHILLREQNTLFDDMFKNFEIYEELYAYMYELLVVGEKKDYSAHDPVVNWALMFGFVSLRNEKVAVHNRIFEIVIIRYFVSKDAHDTDKKSISRVLKYDVVRNGRFDMELCLRKFAEHYRRLFNEDDIDFLERHGKMLFLSYIAPLINGEGFYHVESQLSDRRRMDIVIDFDHEQFIIELKLWYGEAEHEAGYEQLAGYLRSVKAERGYLVTFDLRKPQNRQPKEEWVSYEGVRIFDVVL